MKSSMPMSILEISLSSDFLPTWQYPPLLPSFPTVSQWIFIFIRTVWLCRVTNHPPFSCSNPGAIVLMCALLCRFGSRHSLSAVQAASILWLGCFGLWLLPWHMAVEDDMVHSTYSCPFNSLLSRNTHTAFT